MPAILLNLMHFVEEPEDPKLLNLPPLMMPVGKKELELARQLVTTLREKVEKETGGRRRSRGLQGGDRKVIDLVDRLRENLKRGGVEHAKARSKGRPVAPGMTEPRGSRPWLGSLVAGLYRDGRLVFAGHVGGGFDARMLKEVHGLLAPLRTGKCPFAEPPKTSLGKVYWPGEGYTKGDLIHYYDTVSPWLLPHLKDRPLILKRFPNGIGSPPFFQHDFRHPPPFMKTVEEKEEGGSLVHYALCQNKESLLHLANLGVIPLHPWLSRVPRLDRPDWIVFDLDPQEVPFSEVRKLAIFLGGLLESLGLVAFPKTSGSRGIHLYLPLKPAYTFAQGLGFARLVAGWAVEQMPDAFTVGRSLKIRKRDRVYLDCMQNSRGE